MKEQEIVIQNLNKYYGKKQALFDLNLTIKQGMFGLLGRNGAGKTTLMKTLATLLNKKSGNISICGIPIKNAKEIRRIIGYLPQEFSMYPTMSVTNALDYLGILSGMNKTERKMKIPSLLEKVNMTEHANKKVKELSGGMKRRLGIAQALLHSPKVLIVDEPTAGLDPEERIRFRNLLSEVAEDKIVILSTHIVGDIEATCEKLAILDEGRFLYNGTVNELNNMTKGKVYSMTVPKEELTDIKAKYIVTGILTYGNKCKIRFITAKNTPSDAKTCEPNIEDAYMLCLQKNGVEKYQLGGEI